MSRNGTFAIAFHTLFVAFMLAPLVVVMWMSLTPSNLLSLPTTSFSLRWFWAILRHSQFIDAFWFSILLGVLSASLAMMLAVPAALALARYRFPGRDAFVALFLSPLIIPHVVLGVAFLRFFTQIGMTGTFIGLLGAHVLVIFPYGLRLVLAALTTSDPAIERAAISLGASQWTVFRRVLFPLMIPGVAGGWVISFIQSFDEVTMTVFVDSVLDDAAGAHVPLHRGIDRSAGGLGLDRRHSPHLPAHGHRGPHLRAGPYPGRQGLNARPAHPDLPRIGQCKRSL
ncbi:Putative spermidine/putrescine transport system permease protein OS=Bosea thiooxidans OX=53254 GN=SAMN05660750_02406 PE=3 SV=1 [Bosea thiooxidans]|uniref:Putative spermidine/putrescine transport system permease protein n=1 Tax=Bosea thiooxidans TaxID=53254 RepID=A0A1T5E6T5_9HYPH|nr:putative spermidine/putrescine transport system permease protein [Bosea thiooxidans]